MKTEKIKGFVGEISELKKFGNRHRKILKIENTEVSVVGNEKWINKKLEGIAEGVQMEVEATVNWWYGDDGLQRKSLLVVQTKKGTIGSIHPLNRQTTQDEIDLIKNEKDPEELRKKAISIYNDHFFILKQLEEIKGMLKKIK